MFFSKLLGAVCTGYHQTEAYPLPNVEAVIALAASEGIPLTTHRAFVQPHTAAAF